MLQRSPEYQARLDESSEAHAIAHEQHRMNRRRKAYGAAVLGLLLGAHVSAYATDVETNKQIQSDASVGVSLVGQPLNPEHSHSAIVMIDGFGSYDSTNLAHYMTPVIQQVPELDGNVYSVNYNNASIDTETMAKDVAETLHADDIDDVTMVGYSAGGNIMLGIEDQLIKSDFNIKANIFESVPNGAERLQPTRQNEVDIVKVLKHIPGAQYSTPLRFIGEMAFRAGGYTVPLNGATFGENISIAAHNVENFFDTAADVKKSLADKTLPGTWLMFDQVLAVENGNFKDHIDTLGKLPNTKVHPTLIYAGNPTDGVVDNIGSASDLATIAATANLTDITFDIPGAEHGRPDLATDAYKAAFKEHATAIAQSIERETTVAQMNQMFAKIAVKAEKDLKTQQAEQKAAEKEKANAAINAEDNLNSSEPTPVATPAP